ncbi:MAG: DUF4256 domain-containing protein [Candidatus Gracilibacteria bacterium]
MVSHTPSEARQTEVNRDAHLGRIAWRAERIPVLQGLLTETDKGNVLAALRETGLGLPEGFEDKDLPAMQETIRETITELQAMNDENPGLTTAVEEKLVVTSKAAADVVGNSEPAELSPEHQATLTLLMTRYDENLGKNLYTAESAPKAEVEKWLKADPTRLDKAARWEARGGKPSFTGEENGEFCIDECSAEVPGDVRNICYGPNAAKQQGLGEDRNALTQAERLGGTLMTKTRRAKLFVAGLIKDVDTWEWLFDPKNRDLVMKGDKIEDPGLVWNGGCGGVRLYDAAGHGANGGLRCSLRGKRP